MSLSPAVLLLMSSMHGRVSAAAPGLMTQPAICRGHGNSRRRQQLGAVAAAAPLAQSAAAVQEGAEVVGTVVWAGPKGAKVLLPDDTIGFMPSREAPFVIRDALEDRATPAGREVCRRLLPQPSGLCEPPTLVPCASTCSSRTTEPHPGPGDVRAQHLSATPVAHFKLWLLWSSMTTELVAA